MLKHDKISHVEQKIYKNLLLKYKLSYVNLMDILYNQFLKIYKEFGGNERYPTIAIVDWQTLKTAHEFYIFKKFFENYGHKVEIADPRELKYKNGIT